jgi:hypothetical protein
LMASLTLLGRGRRGLVGSFIRDAFVPVIEATSKR